MLWNHRRLLFRCFASTAVSLTLSASTPALAQSLGGLGGGGASSGGLGGGGGSTGGALGGGAGGGLGGGAGSGLGGGAGGGLGGGGGGAGGGLGGGAGGRSGGGGGSGTGGGSTGVFGGGGAGGGSGSSGSIDQTNFLRGTYSNPAYMGRPNQMGTSSTGSSSASLYQTVTQGLGGFGQPSFGNATATSGVGGTGGGLGSLGGSTGGTASTSTSSVRFSGQSPSTSRLAYTASLKFPTKPVVSDELQSQLRGIIDRSTTLKNPSSIEVVVVEGQTAVLRGRVTDDDERRLAEGLIRLTPGVRQVRNELEAP